MFEINFCADDKSNYGIVSYTAIGSLDQVIEGARLKSFQLPALKYEQWLVRIYQNGEFICTRTMKNGKII